MKRTIMNTILNDTNNKMFDIDEHTYETDNRLIKFRLQCEKTNCKGECEAYKRYEKELRADENND